MQPPRLGLGRLLTPIGHLCLALLSAVTLLACQPDDETLHDLSIGKQTTMCREYLKKANGCPGFDMRCLDQFEGICQFDQLLDMCVDAMKQSTCLIGRWESCAAGDVCNTNEAGGLPCFSACYRPADQQ